MMTRDIEIRLHAIKKQMCIRQDILIIVPGLNVRKPNKKRIDIQKMSLSTQHPSDDTGSPSPTKRIQDNHSRIKAIERITDQAKRVGRSEAKPAMPSRVGIFLESEVAILRHRIFHRPNVAPVFE